VALYIYPLQNPHLNTCIQYIFNSDTSWFSKSNYRYWTWIEKIGQRERFVVLSSFFLHIFVYQWWILIIFYF